MTGSQTFVLMLIGHFFADFNLQGLLKELKQKAWWQQEIKKAGLTRAEADKYRFDHIAALACHGLYWSAIVCLPLFNHPQLLTLVLTNAIAHAIIDDLKCNRYKIGLAVDQWLHLGQIFGTFICGMS